MTTSANPVIGRGARALVTIAAFMIIVAGLRAAGQLVLPFLLSVFLAIITQPLIEWLRRRRVPTPVAVTVTVLAALLTLTVLVVIVGQSINQFTALTPRYQERFQQMGDSLAVQLDSIGVDAEQWRLQRVVNPGAVLDLFGSTLRAVGTLLSNAILVLLTLIFILFEAVGFGRKLRAAFATQPEPLARVTAVTKQVQRYLGIKTLVSFMTGVLVGGWVAVMDIGVPVLWGLLAFFFNFIPNLGSIIAAVPPVFLSLIQFGVGRAIVVTLGYIAINIVVSNVIEPNLMGRRLGLSPLVVLLSLIFWGWVWGPVGMLLAVPLTMILKIALEHTEDLRWVAVLMGSSPREAEASPASHE